MKPVLIALAALTLAFTQAAHSQVAPTPSEIAAYTGLHKAAADGDLATAEKLIASGADLNARDGNSRTPFHVAAFVRSAEIMALLAKAGADVNALDADLYDAVTIAAVADDVRTLKAALAAGNKATNITSIYVGTALIASAHLGHDEVVRTLIEAGAPLDHVNNLGWTALIEAVVLGDGGARHQATVDALVKAGADRSIADRNGNTPLAFAKERGYHELEVLLRQ
jgi:uncharacterized protein